MKGLALSGSKRLLYFQTLLKWKSLILHINIYVIVNLCLLSSRLPLLIFCKAVRFNFSHCVYFIGNWTASTEEARYIKQTDKGWLLLHVSVSISYRDCCFDCCYICANQIFVNLRKINSPFRVFGFSKTSMICLLTVCRMENIICMYVCMYELRWALFLYCWMLISIWFHDFEALHYVKPVFAAYELFVDFGLNFAFDYNSWHVFKLSFTIWSLTMM